MAMRPSTVLALVALLSSACGSSNGGGGSDSASGGAGASNGAGASTASRGGSNPGSGAGGQGTGASTSSGGGEKADGGTSTRSAGCGTAPPHSADFDATSTDGDGTTRNYSVLFPTGYDSQTAVALTFVYHGAGSTSAGAEGFGVQNGNGARAASMFVFPQGINFQSYGVGWDDSCGGRDMPLFDHILSDIEAHYCIDTSRVFAAGFSWGCDQSTALACCRGDKIRAIGAASCTDEFSDPNNPSTYDNLPCPEKHRPAVRFTHDSSGGDAGYAKPLFTTTSKLFVSLNGCTGGDALPAGTCTAHAGCASPFVECPYDALGHATPSNWGPDTWAFLAASP